MQKVFIHNRMTKLVISLFVSFTGAHSVSVFEEETRSKRSGVSSWQLTGPDTWKSYHGGGLTVMLMNCGAEVTSMWRALGWRPNRMSRCGFPVGHGASGGGAGAAAGTGCLCIHSPA